MKWMISEDKLGADQKDAIEEIGKNKDGAVWIKGHAGSGKSVLLLHALKDYVAKNPKSSVCVVVFTNALVDLLKNGLEQIPFLKGYTCPVYTIYEFRNKVTGNMKFNAIFCDEVQDLPVGFLQILKNSTAKVVVAGDISQSIYNSVPSFDERPARPDEIKSTLNAVEKNLTIVYRLTKSMLKVLTKVFPEILSSKIPVSKNDTVIDVWKFPLASEEEIPFIWKKIEETNKLRPSEVAAILINSHDGIVAFCNEVLRINGKEQWDRKDNAFEKPDYTLLNFHLRINGIPLMYVGNNYGSLKEADNRNKIVVMTYHSAKGLDFDSVFLPLTSDEMYFHSKEKELLLVALSRSKNDLVISYSGSVHSTLNLFIGDLPTKSPGNEKTDELDF
jgi:superfamily I DNA/RNA helicase